MLWKANKASDDTGQARRLLKGRELGWDDLVSLVHKNQEYAYQKHLADPSQAEVIERQFFEYLAIRTRLYQIERINQTLQSMGEDPSASPALLEKLWDQLSERRAYNGDDRKDLAFLFYEAASPKGLFKAIQYEKVKTLAKKAVNLAQMPTGFGKTDYLIPMINEMIKKELEHAQDKENETLPMKYKLPAIAAGFNLLNMWPGSIASINSDAISQKTIAATQKTTQQLTFSRESHLDAVQLGHTLLQLERAARKKTPISVRASDVASLFLHWLETPEMLHQGHDNPEARKQAELYSKILTLLHGPFVTIDEAHDVLDPQQKTIYTLGHYTHVPEYAFSFATDVFDLLNKNEKFTKLISENKVLLPEEAETLVTELFSNEMVKELANKLGIKDKDLPQFTLFLKGEGSFDNAEIDQNLINLAKGYRTVIIKAMISGAVNEQFGLSKLYYEKYLFAIPYEKKEVPKEDKDNPVPSSYKNPDETLLKTLKIYHYQGLSQSNLIDLLNTAMVRFAEEHAKHPTKAVESLPTQRAMLDLFNRLGLTTVQQDELVDTAEEDRETRLRAILTPQKAEQFSKDAYCINAFLKWCVAPSIKIFPSSIGMTPQDILMLFPSSVSLSATPQLAQVHSLLTQFVEMKGASGKTYDLLLSKIKEIRQMPADDSAFIEALAAGCRERHIRTVSDPSGLRRFDRNFVEKLAPQFNGDIIEYIVYYDNSAKGLVRYDVITKTLQPFDPKSHNPNKTLTLYDQARSTGTDIVQSPDAVGILIASSAMTVMQAGQGAGRLRQLDKGQALEAWTADPVNDKVDFDEAVAELVKRWLHNGEAASLQKNKVAIQQLMTADIKGAMARKMLGLPLDRTEKNEKQRPFHLDNLLSYYSRYRDVLLGNEPYSPVESYQNIGKATDGKTNLKKDQHSAIQKAKRYFKGGDFKKIAKQLRSYDKVIEEVPLPAKDYGGEVGASQQSQQSVSVQAETQQQQEVARHIQPQPPFIWHKVDRWPKKPQDLFEMDFAPPPFYKDVYHLKKLNKEINEHETRKLASNIVKKSYLGVKIGHKKRKYKKLMKKVEGNIAAAMASSGGQGKVQFVTARDAIAAQLPSDLSAGKAFFSDRLLLSSNFSEQLSTHVSPLLDAENSKNSFELLLILKKENDGTTTYTGVIVDTTDTQQLNRLLDQSRSEEGFQSTLKIALYSPLLGITCQGGNPITPEELQDCQVAHLVAEAKLLLGDHTFNEQEQTYFDNKARLIDASNNKREMNGKQLFDHLLSHLKQENLHNDGMV